MERKLQTTKKISELTSEDLKRLIVPKDRVYLACRHGKEYRQEKLYEFAIMSKDGTRVIFATEEDLLTRLTYPVEKIEFLEPKSIASYIDTSHFECVIVRSKKMPLARFPELQTLSMRRAMKNDFRFSYLAKINQKSLTDQKRYIDRKDKEFDQQQKDILTKQPIHLRDF